MNLFAEDDVMLYKADDDVIFYKATERYVKPGMCTDKFIPKIHIYRIAQTGLDFDNSPDYEVLSCETMLTNNDVRLQLTITTSNTTSITVNTALTSSSFIVYTVFHLQGYSRARPC